MIYWRIEMISGTIVDPNLYASYVEAVTLAHQRYNLRECLIRKIKL